MPVKWAVENHFHKKLSICYELKNPFYIAELFNVFSPPEKLFSTYFHKFHAMLSFKLDDDFVMSYAHIQPDFGFNGLGQLTYYYRTYSRLKGMEK